MLADRSTVRAGARAGADSIAVSPSASGNHGLRARATREAQRIRLTRKRDSQLTARLPTVDSLTGRQVAVPLHQIWRHDDAGGAARMMCDILLFWTSPLLARLVRSLDK